MLQNDVTNPNEQNNALFVDHCSHLSFSEMPEKDQYSIFGGYHAKQEHDVQEYKNKQLQKEEDDKIKLFTHRSAKHVDKDKKIVWGGPGDCHNSMHQI